MRHRFTVIALALLIASGLSAPGAIGTATPAASSARDNPGGLDATAVTDLAGWPARPDAPCLALSLTNGAGRCQNKDDGKTPRRAAGPTDLERRLAGGDVASDHFVRPGATGGAEATFDVVSPTLWPTPFRRAAR